MGSLLDSVRTLIESGPLAHLVTLNPDGSPQVTIVWIGIEDDEIVSGHLFRHRKSKHPARPARGALPGGSGSKRDRDAQLRGALWTGADHGGRGAELLQRLAYTYVGPGGTFPPMAEPPPGYITRIRVERITGQGPWADER